MNPAPPALYMLAENGSPGKSDQSGLWFSSDHCRVVSPSSNYQPRPTPHHPPICLKSVFYPSIFPATDEIVMHEFLYGAQWIYWLYPNVFTEPEDWSIYLLLCSWHMACLSFAITASHFVRSPRQSNQVFLRFISLYRITLKVAVDELTHKKGLTAMLNIYVYVFFCPDPEF